MKSSINEQAKIFWLASYPKSGNTWTRVFIANLMSSTGPIDINQLNTGSIASSREWVEQALGFDINELSHDEIDKIRPLAYQYLSQHSDAIEYHKVHDAYSYVDGVKLNSNKIFTKINKQALFPNSATRGVLYLVRNPLDVAISFAHHCGWSIDTTINNMSNTQQTFSGGSNKLYNQLRQHLYSWTMHVQSWLDAPIDNKLFVRYEDMKLSPFSTFSKMAKFLELPYDESSIKKAIGNSEIKQLQAQEEVNVFKEKSNKADSFFRKGIVGDWQERLTQSQVNHIINDHGRLMKQFGYLDDDKNHIYQ